MNTTHVAKMFILSLLSLLVCITGYVFRLVYINHARGCWFNPTLYRIVFFSLFNKQCCFFREKQRTSKKKVENNLRLSRCSAFDENACTPKIIKSRCLIFLLSHTTASLSFLLLTTKCLRSTNDFAYGTNCAKPL